MKKFFIEDVEIIQDKDIMGDDMLSRIVGGVNLAASCTCKCGLTNCYEDGPTTPIKEEGPEPL